MANLSDTNFERSAGGGKIMLYLIAALLALSIAVPAAIMTAQTAPL